MYFFQKTEICESLQVQLLNRAGVANLSSTGIDKKISW